MPVREIDDRLCRRDNSGVFAAQVTSFEVMPSVIEYDVDVSPSVPKRIDRGSSQTV